MCTDIDWHAYRFAAAAASCFLAILLVLLYMLFRIVLYTQTVFSYQGIFTVLSLIWVLLRTIFFFGFAMCADDWPLPALRVLYWMPPVLEFATFSLILLFFAQVVFLQNWRQGGARRFKIAVYGFWVFNTIFLLWTIGWLAAVGDKETMPDGLVETRTIMNGTIFAILAILTLLCTARLLRVRSRTAGFRIRLPQGLTPTRLSVLMTVILLIFVSRCGFDLLGDLWLNSDASFGVSNLKLNPAGLAELLLWEACPIVLILFVFRRIRGTAPKASSVAKSIQAADDQGQHTMNSPLLSGASLRRTESQSSGTAAGSRQGRSGSASVRGHGHSRGSSYASDARTFVETYGTAPGFRGSNIVIRSKALESPVGDQQGKVHATHGQGASGTSGQGQTGLQSHLLASTDGTAGDGDSSAMTTAGGWHHSRLNKPPAASVAGGLILSTATASSVSAESVKSNIELADSPRLRHEPAISQAHAMLDPEPGHVATRSRAHEHIRHQGAAFRRPVTSSVTMVGTTPGTLQRTPQSAVSSYGSYYGRSAMLHQAAEADGHVSSDSEESYEITLGHAADSLPDQIVRPALGDDAGL